MICHFCFHLHHNIRPTSKSVTTPRVMFGHKYIMHADTLYAPTFDAIFSIPLHGKIYPISCLYICDNFSPPIQFSSDSHMLKNLGENNKRSKKLQ